MSTKELISAFENHKMESKISTSDEDRLNEAKMNAKSTKRLIRAFEQSNVGTPEFDPESPTKKNILIVLAHHNGENSLNGTIFQAAKELFEEEGDNVEVSDLYAMKFNPVISKEDFLHTTKDIVDYAEESRKGYEGNTLSPDIAAEQEKIKKADLIIIQTPIFWSGLPAILKGWFDRILSPSFAFSYDGLKILNNGLLNKKKLLLSYTTGSPETCYSPIGLLGDKEVSLWPLLYGTFHFCGFQILNPHEVHNTHSMKKETIEQMLQEWKNRLKSVWSETTRNYHNIESYDLSKGFQLSNPIVNGEVENPAGVPSTIGQHMNKPIKSMY